MSENRARENCTGERLSISPTEDDEDDSGDDWLFSQPPKPLPEYLEHEYTMTPEDRERSRRKQEKFRKDYITSSIVYLSFLMVVVTVTQIVKFLT